MIEVDLTVYITADDDAQADRLLAQIRELGTDFPDTPMVSIQETRREAERL